MFRQIIIHLWLHSIASGLAFAIPGDADNDGLRDEVETNTGVFISASNTGTNPNLADSDGDSLPDGMEITLGTNPVNAASKIKRPNIIYILTDDLGYGDVGCFWQNQRTGSGIWRIQTPNLDTMAAEGAMLTHHYVGAPVCAGSRASFLQGRHQGHADVRGVQFDKALPNNHSVSSLLQTGGYRTVHIGKAGVNGTMADSSQSSLNLEGHPLKRGFDRFFGYLIHNDGRNHYPQNGAPPYLSNIHLDYTPVTDAFVDLYTTDAWTAFAKKTIIEETSQHPERPFFIYLSYEAPHFDGQFSPTADYPAGGGVSGGLQWTGAPSYVNTATNDPLKINNPANKHPSAGSTWYPAAQKYVSMIRRIDDAVGDILQTLRDLNIDDNTLVVFSSDNGPTDKEIYPPSFQSYGGFEGIKFDLWEGGIRVPTIAWWPGQLQGSNNLSDIREITRPCANWDWMATFAEMAKVPIPALTDGVSMVPAFLGQETNDFNRFLYFEFLYGGFTSLYPDFSNHGGETRGEMQAIRVGDFMGVRYNIKSAEDSFRIYNVVTDPKQGMDLAAFKPDLQDRMKYLAVGARRKGAGISRNYDNTLIRPIPVPSVINGIRWNSYEGYWPLLPEFRNLSKTSSGLGSEISPSFRSRDKDSGLSFEAYLSVPTSGAYTFQLTSDASTCMWVHDGRVIDNDFNFTSTKTSDPVYLSAGLHPIRLYYRHQEGSAALELKYSGPGISLQKIPAASFFVDGPPPPPADRDGDGSPDAEELIAGTNPDDSSSYLRIRSISRENGSITLRWEGSAGRTYRVQESADLSSWKPVPNLDPLVLTTAMADAFRTIPENGDPKRFFRLSASITPPQPPPDRDGDGSPDDAEAIAGTNPDDPASYFKIHTFAKSENGMSLQWAGVAGRTYRVEESIDLSIWTFVPGMAPVVVSSPQPAASAVVPSNGATKRFLRMQVMLTQ